MFNKNDPIAASVKQVMEQNARERAAAAAVNEKFGIVDRKALPHERQGEWDAAYKATLSEELKGNQHKIDANKNKRIDSHDFKLLRMKKKLAESGGSSAGYMMQADKERKSREMNKMGKMDNTMPAGADKVKLKGNSNGPITSTTNTSADTTGDLARDAAKNAAPAKIDSDRTNRGSDPTNTNSGQRKGTQVATNRGSDPTNTDSGQRKGAAPVAPKPKLRPSGMSTKKTVVKKVQPTGSSAPKQKEPSAFQKWEARRRLEKGQSLGPQYNRDRKISGTKLGVTTGKTVFQRKK